MDQRAAVTSSFSRSVSAQGGQSALGRCWRAAPVQVDTAAAAAPRPESSNHKLGQTRFKRGDACGPAQRTRNPIDSGLFCSFNAPSPCLPSVGMSMGTEVQCPRVSYAKGYTSKDVESMSLNDVRDGVPGHSYIGMLLCDGQGGRCWHGCSMKVLATHR
jgi:hypothetical protein